MKIFSNAARKLEEHDPIGIFRRPKKDHFQEAREKRIGVGQWEIIEETPVGRYIVVTIQNQETMEIVREIIRN